MTWQEKRQARFERWLNPPIEFASAEGKATYQGRVQRLIDAIELKKTPDRVPIYPNHTFMPAYIMGKTPRPLSVLIVVPGSPLLGSPARCGLVGPCTVRGRMASLGVPAWRAGTGAAMDMAGQGGFASPVWI